MQERAVRRWKKDAASMNHNGRRSDRLRRSWAAPRRPCGAGFGRQIDQGKRAGVTPSDAERIAQLERENRELRKANEILEMASAFFAQAELERRTKS